MQKKRSAGQIEVICGSMFSGKSEELIRQVRRALYGNIRVHVFKPAMDDRYADEAIVSHNGTSVVARPVQKATQMLDVLVDGAEIVAVDEAQFFDDGLIEVTQTLANKGIDVLIAGLDTDFRGEPFGPMPELLAISNTVNKLSAICPICRNPASRTQRLIDGRPALYDDPIILLGAQESYEPRCRHHHEVPRTSEEREITRTINIQPTKS